VRMAVGDEEAVLVKPVLLLSRPGCPPQRFHRDLRPSARWGRPGTGRFCGGAVLSLEEGAYLDWFPGSHCLVGPRRDVPPVREAIQVGEAFVFHASTVHAGGSLRFAQGGARRAL